MLGSPFVARARMNTELLNVRSEGLGSFIATHALAGIRSPSIPPARAKSPQSDTRLLALLLGQSSSRYCTEMHGYAEENEYFIGCTGPTI